MTESEEDNAMEHKPDYDHRVDTQAKATANTPPRNRWSRGLTLHGILTALGALALVVVE